MTLRISLVVLLLLAACADEPSDELDPEVVSSLSIEVGDARGVAPSGVYAVELIPEECGCGDINPSLWALTLCERGAFGPVAPGAVLQTTFDVVVSDGVIGLASESTTANPIGALQADGAFVAGGVTRMTSFATTGYLITRVEGTLEQTAEDDYAIEGRVQVRLIGRVELTGLDDVVTGIEDVDCRESITFYGDRDIVR